MDSVSSDTNTSVFASPDSVAELSNGRKFETSVSVSSLAEKFEKSGEFDKSEEKPRTPSEMEKSLSLTENLENKTVNSESNGAVVQPSSDCVSCYEEVNGNSEGLKSTVTNQAEVIENGKVCGAQSFHILSDPSMSVKEEINGNSPSSSLLSSSADLKSLNSICQNGSDIDIDPQTSSAIEERVNYFVNQIAKSSENFASGAMISKDDTNVVPRDVMQGSSCGYLQHTEGVSKKLSMEELEQTFIKALNMVNSENEAKTADSLPVPVIEITEASDREDNSDDSEETKPASVRVKAKVEATVGNKVEDADTRKSSDNGKPTSTNIVSQDEMKETSDVSIEERKAFFYISSSDLPVEPQQESAENSDELQRSSENGNERENSARVQESSETRTTCLRSKTCHGITFLLAFVVAIFGCILYGFAHQGKVPDYCEYLGLIIAIMAGVVGAFSCFCYSCLEIFPGLSRREGYERIPDAGFIPSLPPQNATANANDQNLDDSWSSEKERAFRIQNGMSSTRTSAASLKSDLGEYLFMKKSEHRELVDTTEKLRKGVVELLDSFNAVISKMEPIDKLVEMESGTMNG